MSLDDRDVARSSCRYTVSEHCFEAPFPSTILFGALSSTCCTNVIVLKSLIVRTLQCLDSSGYIIVSSRSQNSAREAESLKTAKPGVFDLGQILVGRMPENYPFRKFGKENGEMRLLSFLSDPGCQRRVIRTQVAPVQICQVPGHVWKVFVNKFLACRFGQ